MLIIIGFTLFTINPLQHDTVIPRLIYPAPLEPGSQAAVGLTSTAMGDLAGISGAVSFLLKCGMYEVTKSSLRGFISFSSCLMYLPPPQTDAASGGGPDGGGNRRRSSRRRHCSACTNG